MEGAEGRPVLVSSETSDDEMFVELDAEELEGDGEVEDDVELEGDGELIDPFPDDGDTTGAPSEIASTAAVTENSCVTVVVSSSTSSTMVCDSDEMIAVSSSVHNRTLSDVDTSSVDSSEAVTARSGSAQPEIASTTAVTENNFVSVVVSSSSATVCDDDDASSSATLCDDEMTGVSGTFSDVETSTTWLAGAVTACSANEEIETTLSQTALLGDSVHSRSCDKESLPVHSAMETEGQTDKSGTITAQSTCITAVNSTSASASTSCRNEKVQILSSSEPGNTMTDVEPYGTATGETAAVCYSSAENSTASPSHITRSRRGRHAGRATKNLTDISAVGSVNLRKLAAYSGLKDVHIVLNRVEAVPVSSVCVKNSMTVQKEGTKYVKATADISPAGTVFPATASKATSLLPSAEASPSPSEGCVTANTVSLTKEFSVIGGVPSADDAAAVAGNLSVADSSFLTDVNERGMCNTDCDTRLNSLNVGEAVELSIKVDEIVDVDKSLCGIGGSKRPYAGDSVEGSLPKHQKMEEGSLSLSVAAGDEVCCNMSEQSMITKSSSPGLATDVGQELTNGPSDSNFTATEDVTMTGQLVVEGASSMNDAIAVDDQPLAPDGPASTPVEITESFNADFDSHHRQNVTPACSDPFQDVEAVSSVNEAIGADDNSLAPDSSASAPERITETFNADFDSHYRQNVIPASSEAFCDFEAVSSVNEEVDTEDHLLAPDSAPSTSVEITETFNADFDSHRQQNVTPACSEAFQDVESVLSANGANGPPASDSSSFTAAEIAETFNVDVDFHHQQEVTAAELEGIQVIEGQLSVNDAIRVGDHPLASDSPTPTPVEMTETFYAEFDSGHQQEVTSAELEGIQVVEGVSSTNDVIAVNEHPLVPDSLASTAVEITETFNAEFESSHQQEVTSAELEGIQIVEGVSSVNDVIAVNEHPLVSDSLASTPVEITETFNAKFESCHRQEVTSAELEGIQVVEGVSSVHDVIAVNEHPLVSDSLASTAVEITETFNAEFDSSHQQEVTSAELEGIQVVEGVSSMSDVIAVEEHPLASESMACTPMEMAETFNADFDAHCQQVTLAEVEGIQFVVVSVNDAVAVENQLVSDGPTFTVVENPETFNAEFDAGHQQLVISTELDGIPVCAVGCSSTTVDEVHEVTASDSRQSFVTSPSAAVVVSSIPSAPELAADAVKSWAGTSRAIVLPPPPPSVTNAGSKMRMRMEAANKEKLPATAAVNKRRKVGTITAAAKETTSSRLDAELSTAVTDVVSSIPAAMSDSVSADKSQPSGQHRESEEQALSAGEKKDEPLMDWRPPPTKSAALKDVVAISAPADESSVTSDEKTSAEPCDNKNDKKKAMTDWRPPPSRTAAVKSLFEWKPAPGWKPRMTSDEDLRNLAVDFPQPSINVPPCTAHIPTASLAPVLPPNVGQPVVPPGVVSGHMSSGQPVMVPVQVNSGQPPPHIGVGPPPAVLPPGPLQPAMVPPPTLNCQGPPPMQAPPPMVATVAVATLAGQSGVVLPPVSGTHICTPPRVVPDNPQQAPLSFTQTPPPILCVPPPNVSPQAQRGPSPGQTVPPGVVPDNQRPPASFTQTPPPVLPVPPPNVSPQAQRGPSPCQTVPPPMSGAQPRPQVRPLLSTPVQGQPPPANVRFGPNHPPRPGVGPHYPPPPGVGPHHPPPPGVGPHPVLPPQPVPPVHQHPRQQFIPPHGPPPPGPGQLPPQWGPSPPPYAAPPMWGPPHQGIPPPGFNQPHPGVHGPAVPQEWGPPPGAPYMQPGFAGADGGWWGPPPAGVPHWGPPHGPPDWSYQPEPSTGPGPLDPGYNAETATGDNETEALAQAARGWAEWQQRYSEWYYKYWGCPVAPVTNASSISNNTVATTSSVTTKASSAVKTKASSTEQRVSKSNASSIPLPAKPAVEKPSLADAFASFVKQAASNTNFALGISSNKPPQNVAKEPVSSSTNVSNTSGTPTDGEHLSVQCVLEVFAAAVYNNDALYMIVLSKKHLSVITTRALTGLAYLPGARLV